MRDAAFRRWSTLLLTVLVVATIGSLAVISFGFVSHQNQVTQHLVTQTRDELRAAEVSRMENAAATQRNARLEARRVRLSVLVETCVILRLEGQDLPRCEGVRGRVHKLVRVIRDFRSSLREQTRTVTVTAAPEPGSTRTETVAAPPSPSPHVGNSDQCPPKNPSC